MGLRRCIKMLILAVLTSALFLMYYTNIVWNNNEYVETVTKKPLKMKYILFWNKFSIRRNFGYGSSEGQQLLLDNNCSVNMCYTTNNRSMLPVEEFDAILFHAFKYNPTASLRSKKGRDAPHVRKPQQIYVFFMLEPPQYKNLNYRIFDNFFNWTMTYRLDSDIPRTYGLFITHNSSSLTPPLKSPTWIEPSFDQYEAVREIVTKKTKLVAWLVSNCKSQSRREEYVKEMSKSISIDVYGRCGNLSWPKGHSDSFYAMLSDSYKFYLSFENSLCKDYVTEKLFEVMQHYVVPIVYGGADYKHVAPPMSYIDVRDYESPQELVKYLMFLDQNPEEYAKYFWWKSHYKALGKNPQSLCKLCEMLHSDNLHKTYTNMNEWWGPENICQKENPYLIS